MRNRSLKLAMAVLFLSAPAMAADLTVSRATLRVISPSVPAAGYFVLANAGTAPVTLTGAQSAACGMLMMHKSSTEGGMARMDDVASLVVPPHGKIAFAPGAYHLMCMDPSAALATARTAPVRLEFKDHPPVETDFTVTNALGRPR